jgi:hypothetical protein
MMVMPAIGIAEAQAEGKWTRLDLGQLLVKQVRLTCRSSVGLPFRLHLSLASTRPCEMTLNRPNHRQASVLRCRLLYATAHMWLNNAWPLVNPKRPEGLD